jgi:hypothetical protein
MAKVSSFKVAGSRIESPPPVGGYESYSLTNRAINLVKNKGIKKASQK